MASPSNLLLLPLSLLLLSSLSTTKSAPNTDAVSVLCNSASYGTGDPFAASLPSVLSELLAATPSRAGHDFRNISPYPNAFAYGHAACRANLTGADCASCLHAAAGQMSSTCAGRIGARAVLVDCKIRYEQYPFVD